VASAKVKNSQAGYNKVLAGMNTFYDRYGFFPGDGCTSTSVEDPTACSGTKDGIVDGDNEESSFFSLMTATEILTDADTKSALGSAWNATGDANATFIYVEGADLRLVCDLDRKADDGDSDDGDIRATQTTPVSDPFDGEDLYDSDTDCWDQTGNAAVELKVLP
jgi:hypothetical protein